MLISNLVGAGLLVVVTFLIHFVGLAGLSIGMRRLRVHPSNLSTLFGQGLAILSLVIGLFTLHSIEIWVYAIAYYFIDAVSDFETALYFSTSAFSTVGFGDVTLGEDWRMLGAVESVNGFLLIGWSTAFLVGISGRVRAFAADVEHLEGQKPAGIDKSAAPD